MLRPLMGSVLVALAIHWFFQCLLAMDHTERAFKLLADAILTVIFYLLLRLMLPDVAALCLAWLSAHTLNFIFNSQIYSVLKSFGYVKHSMGEFTAYIRSFTGRAQRQPGIRWAAIYGSLARGELAAASDLDIRVIRAPGLRNAARACLFTMAERTRALLARFPLDILLLDSPRLLQQLRPDEPPQVILDTGSPAGPSHG